MRANVPGQCRCGVGACSMGGQYGAGGVGGGGPCMSVPAWGAGAVADTWLHPPYVEDESWL